MNEENNKEDLLCPLRYVLNIIGGKWKLPIICILADGQSKRYGEIKKQIPDITDMMLSQSLKDLEAHSVIMRKQYNQVPPRVEYTLAEDMMDLLKPLVLLGQWGAEHMASKGINASACDACRNHK